MIGPPIMLTPMHVHILYVLSIGIFYNSCKDVGFFVSSAELAAVW